MKVIEDMQSGKKLEKLEVGDVIRCKDEIGGYDCYALVVNDDIGKFLLIPLETGDTMDTLVESQDTLDKLINEINANYEDVVKVDAELHVKGVIDEK